MANLTTRLHNAWAQLRYPDIKIFFIGYNKCGTTSIHHLLRGAAIRSAHFNMPVLDVNPLRPRKMFAYYSVNLATAIEGRRTDNSLRKILDRFTAYSDLFFSSDRSHIESNAQFRRFHDMYSDSYFILNDRNIEKWIASRRKHDDGDFLRRAMNYYSATAAEVEAIWREQRERHVDEVCSYFKGHDKFLYFNIDTDSIEALVSFLGPNFRVEPNDWKVHNRTSSSKPATYSETSPI